MLPDHQLPPSERELAAAGEVTRRQNWMRVDHVLRSPDAKRKSLGLFVADREQREAAPESFCRQVAFAMLLVASC